MLSKVLLVVLVTVALCMVHCCAAEDTTNDPKTGMSNGVNKDGESAELSQTDIMLMCNESFRTSMEYLVELNTTGAFPDETDKTPMCYIRCYLENVGILKDDALNHDKAIEMAWSTTDEALDECAKESSDRTNPCEKAYFMTRCIMMRNIVDNRNTEHQQA